MGAIQAALTLYEREVGPMPDKVSYTEQILQMEKVAYSHTASVGVVLPLYDKKRQIPRIS